MRNGTCPKCGSTEVHANAHIGEFTRSGTNWANTIPIGIIANAVLDNYVCSDCGYTESYISNRAQLSKIMKKWPRVMSDHADEFVSGRKCPYCEARIGDKWKACPYCGQVLV